MDEGRKSQELHPHKTLTEMLLKLCEKLDDLEARIDRLMESS
jgi:hypothetical protein